MKRLVTAHGGKISLQSKVGQGSTFKVTLPIHQPDESTCCSADESKRGSIEIVRPLPSKGLALQISLPNCHDVTCFTAVMSIGQCRAPAQKEVA